MNSLAQLLRELGPSKLSILAFIGFALLAAFIMLSFRFSSVNYAPLYTNLESRDSGHIMAELESKGIPYRLENNGTQISVTTDRVLQLRMMLAENGLPSSGSIAGYEIFDSPDSLGTSNFVHNVNLIRALEGELGRTISAFDSVEQARVHLVIPKRELFSREKMEPTASVVLQLKNQLGLKPSEVKAISHVIATAVSGLKVSNITIVDTQGRPLKLGAEDENDSTVLAANAEEYRVAVEKRMRNKIEELLERSVGLDKVKAKVSADIDFDRVVTNSESYDPDGQVVRSVQTVEEKEAASESNKDPNVSVENNLPTSKAESGGGGNNSNSEKVDETINYEISKKVENHIKESGTIKRLSIAVLIDGTYQLNDKTGNLDYVPRTQDELDKLKALVTSAVGFDEKRGDTIEVVNMQFSREIAGEVKETPLDWIKRELHNILQTLVVAIVVILVILLVIKPMVSRAFELTKVEEEEEEFEAALRKSEDVVKQESEDQETGVILDMDRIANRVKVASLKNINEIVEKYPEETLSVLRNWLNKDRA